MLEWLRSITSHLTTEPFGGVGAIGKHSFSCEVALGAIFFTTRRYFFTPDSVNSFAYLLVQVVMVVCCFSPP